MGESGCGKSTTGQAEVKLLEAGSGRIMIEQDGQMVDMAGITAKEDCDASGAGVQMIFQDPFESLNPRRTVYDTIAEPLTVQRIGASRNARNERCGSWNWWD